ncbi:sulfatase [Rhodopirellula sp. JC740]|uniref:Sulfatase n=1 Tax=Rhodopirellula halodulae TaxID=2894198 RepID=A0ABS8NDZ0_9BACT|nr:sulfatase [Rhodopirellula sp. JC740]MCC9641770.1 sulfatase [Rhodopirellula sp. JC740]
MKNFKPTFWIALLIGILGPSSAIAKDATNFVFIIADDCTFRDLGCYGGQAHTPRIDALAEEGMRFTRCFQSVAMCSPTRHSIYCGQYPVKTGAYPNHTFVPDGTSSVVQFLKPLGYRVAHSGKGHIGPPSVFSWERLPGKSNPDFAAVDEFLHECGEQEQPFCLFLCSNEPHTPWNKGDASRYNAADVALPPYLADTPETREGMTRYLAEITYFDSQVGQAIDLLDQHQLAENTLLIVVSEQGNSMPFAKWTCYDSGLQSGCIVRWPGHVEAGSINPAMMEYIDFLPTWIEIAGGDVESGPATKLDGKSLLPVLAGEQTHKSLVFGEMTTRGINSGSDHYGIRSVRSDRYKYIWNFTPEVTFQNACTESKEFKSWIKAANAGDTRAAELVSRYQHRPEIEFYDLQKDPLELNNLATDPQYEATMTSLRKELDDWMQYCGDQGQATEMDALNHMKRGQPKKKKNKQKRSVGD